MRQKEILHQITNQLKFYYFNSKLYNYKIMILLFE